MIDKTFIVRNGLVIAEADKVPANVMKIKIALEVSSKGKPLKVQVFRVSRSKKMLKQIEGKNIAKVTPLEQDIWQWIS